MSGSRKKIGTANVFAAHIIVVVHTENVMRTVKCRRDPRSRIVARNAWYSARASDVSWLVGRFVPDSEGSIGMLLSKKGLTRVLQSIRASERDVAGMGKIAGTHCRRRSCANMP